MKAYYNEIDPFAAAWLKELIKAGHIADGEVDTRSIEDVLPQDLAGFTQCHFFAGIGVWSYALRRAGWPDDRPVWTGSCPCQSFSTAGKGKGFADERHLWPSWFWLIEQCRPSVVFGEQVEAAVRHGWLDLVQDDLEGIGYACGPVPFPAASLGAPHIRGRLYFVADTRQHESVRRDGLRYADGCDASAATKGEGTQVDRQWKVDDVADGGAGCSLADAERERGCSGQSRREDASHVGIASETGGLGNTQHARLHSSQIAGGNAAPVCNSAEGSHGSSEPAGTSDSRTLPSFTNGFWRDADWLWCRDEKYRPVEPGTFPLAHGAAARVGRLRGYGNAIVAPQAEAFIKAYLAT